MFSQSQDSQTRTRNKWLSLIAASIGMYLVSLDISVNVALPDLTTSFGTDIQTVQWIIIFYVGSTTGLQLSLGSAVDRYGLRRLYIIGIITYTVAVLIIGISPTIPMVFGFRVVQAIGNGLILASGPALVSSIFQPDERGKGLGLMSSIMILGMVTGALFGGVLVDSFGWRAIFLCRVPLGIAALVLAIVVLRGLKNNTNSGPFDVKGSLTLFVGLASLILFLSLGGTVGWASPKVLVLALVSIFSLVGFVFIQYTAENPVLDLSLIKRKILGPVMLTSYLMFMATFANWFILPFYMSEVLGTDAKALGFMLMLMGVVGATWAPAGGWLSDRISPAYVSTIALIFLTFALFWFIQLTIDSSVTDVAVRMAAIGFGIGLFQAANATLVMNLVPSDKLGTGGAVLSLCRSLGNVSSVAIIGAFFSSRLDLHSSVLGYDNRGESFVSAFHDAYLVSGAIAMLAVVISLGYWPVVLKLRKRILR